MPGVKLAGVDSPIVRELDDTMTVARKHDALQVTLPSGLSFTLAPKPMDLSALRAAEPELPADPGDPSLDGPNALTSPYAPAGRSKPASTKRKPKPDPMNPDDPPGEDDFPPLPPVPGDHPVE